MNLETFSIFLAASFFLWITPGQDTIYIIARSISQGRLAGIVSALGIGTGGLVHAVLATAGVSIIILTSPVLFLLVKIIGGVYLVYLGLRSLFSKSTKTNALSVKNAKLSQIYSQGVITNVFNPKVALFFIAFLPQFVSSSSMTSSLFFLGFTFVAGGTIWCLIIACFASSFALKLGRSNIVQNWLSKLTGVVYIALGINVLRVKV